MPPSFLIREVFPRAVAPFLAATIEHLAIAKAFARKNDYVIDPAQELVYLGVTNFFNSFFSAMPIGGAMSRTAVNSATGVKSPVYGLVAGGFVIISIFALSPALFWIPKATLAAIIVIAVWSILSPPKTFVHYWKTSFVDFTASMLAFWVTLFVSTEAGIGSAVGFQLAYHVLYSAFTRVRRITSFPTTPSPRYTPVSDNPYSTMPSDIQVFKPHQSLVFFNAFSIKGQCIDTIQTYSSGANISFEVQRKNRNWSTAGERRTKALRRHAGITNDPYRLQVVVLDLSMVASIDDTGLVALKDLIVDIEKFAGEDAELRFASMHDTVRERFGRFGWEVYDVETVEESRRREMKGNAVYRDVADAVADGWRRGGDDVTDVMVVGSEKV
jgi:sodium-independent sulfate anion transporter 11